MGENSANAGLAQTDRGFGRLLNVAKIGQGLQTDAQEGLVDQASNQLSALQRRAEEDFSRSSSIQSLAGTAAGLGAGYGLQRSESRYT